MRRLAMCAVVMLFTACAMNPVAKGVSTFADLALVNEALKGVHSAIDQADQATKDRLGDANSRIEKLIHDTDRLLKEHENRAEQIANDVLDKTFRESNEQLFLLSQITQEAGVDYGWQVNKAIINAGHVLQGIPFAHVRPFVAAVYPTVLMPSQNRDYTIKLLGYFNHQWGAPEFVFDDGKHVAAALEPDSTVSLVIPRAMVAAQEGHRVHVKLRYPDEKGVLRAAKYTERDLFLNVLPKTVVRYSIVEAQATPDAHYDYPQVTRSENTNADAGEGRNRDIVWSMDDLSSNVDFVKVYDRNASSITTAILTAQGGNNPTSDNSNTLTETSGQRVVLHQYAHGKPAKGFEGGKGANVTATVLITLKLAQRMAPVEWQLTGGARAGDMTWGNELVFLPTPEKPLERARVEFTDFTFDPPQQKVLKLRESYRSKYVVVESDLGRIKFTVRSNPIPTM
jgi:hypothetical protein